MHALRIIRHVLGSLDLLAGGYALIASYILFIPAQASLQKLGLLVVFGQ